MRLLVRWPLALVLALVCSCANRIYPVGDGGYTTGDQGNAGQPDLLTPCQGRACQVPSCQPGQTTQITGRVLAGNGTDPVPNAAVFIPTADLPDLPAGVSCDLCNGLPAAVATTNTAYDGSFTLKDVPAGSLPLVVQLGHFRRVVTFTVNPCVDNTVPTDSGVTGFGVRLPRTDAELSPQDRIPKIAVASGDYDQIECVLKRMGVDAIDMYNDRGFGQEGTPPSIAELNDLLSDQARLLSYNILVINCTNNQYEALIADPTIRANLLAFVTAGGRLYATDWAYDVINQIDEFSPYVCFQPQTPPDAPMCGAPESPTIGDTTSNYGGPYTVLDPGLAQWLGQFPSTINAKQEVTVTFSFVIINSVATDAAHKTTVWLQGTTPFGVRPQTVTFDYNQCGRVHFSTYNTEPNGTVDDTMRWPNNCAAAFSPQERLLEYLLFNVASCVSVLG